MPWFAGIRSHFARVARPGQSPHLLPIARARPSPRLVNGTWPHEFIQGQTVANAAFNRTYIEQLRDDWAEDDIADDAGEATNPDTEEAEEDEEIENNDANNVGRSGENAVGDGPKKDNSVAGVFMKNQVYLDQSESEGSWQDWHHGAEVVTKFCGDVTFDSLDTPDLGPGPLGHLEDSSQTGKFRRSKGGLTAQKLHLVLRKPVGRWTPHPLGIHP
jgi:hypothetical protein